MNTVNKNSLWPRQQLLGWLSLFASAFLFYLATLIIRWGEPVVTIEAMKMEHQLKAPLDGTVSIHVTDGQQVGLNQNILTVTGAHATDDED